MKLVYILAAFWAHATAAPMKRMVPSTANNQASGEMTRYGSLRGFLPGPAEVAKFDATPHISRGLASTSRNPDDTSVIATQPGLQEVALFEPMVEKHHGPFTVINEGRNVETKENYYDKAWKCSFKEGYKPSPEEMDDFKEYYDKLVDDYHERGHGIHSRYGHPRAYVAHNADGETDLALRTEDDEDDCCCCSFREVLQARNPKWDYKATCTRKDCDDCPTRQDEVRVQPYFRELFCCVCCPQKTKRFGPI